MKEGDVSITRIFQRHLSAEDEWEILHGAFQCKGRFDSRQQAMRVGEVVSAMWAAKRGVHV